MKHDWTYKQIGDVCDVLNGLWTGKKPPFVNVGVIRNTNFTKDCKLDPSNIFYTDVEVKAYSKRKLQHGDIIIEKSGGSDKQPVGRPILFNLDGEFSFSNFTSVLRITKETLLADFLHKVLTSIYYQGKTRALQSKTTGIHNLDFNKYLRFNIPVPPLEVQQQIVSELDKLSLVIEKKKQQVKELDNLAQAIFYDMFGDPMENEKGWEVKTVKEISNNTYWLMPATPEFQSEGVAYITSKNIKNKEILFEETKFISPIDYANLTANRTIEIGDFLITMIGTIGESAFVKTSTPFYGQNLYLVRLDIKQVNRTYFGCLFSSSAIQDKIKNKKNSSTQAYIKAGTIEKLLCILPPLPLQQSFAQKVESIERQKELINQSIREAQTLFDSRMEFYFGE